MMECGQPVKNAKTASPTAGQHSPARAVGGTEGGVEDVHLAGTLQIKPRRATLQTS